MKLWFLILLLSISELAFGQCVSNNPYELYWETYLIEYDSLTIANNKIKSVTAVRLDLKNAKEKNKRMNYKIEFNEGYLPIKYTYYLEFDLRNDYRYNPFWRMFNDFPVYTIWEYDLKYDQNKRLKEVIV